MASKAGIGADKRALAKYDAELAALAEGAAAQEANTGGGQFFSLKGGTLKLNDAPLPNNEMAVVIVDSVLENVFYKNDFDPDNPQSPDCYAFGRDEDTMTPHAEAPDHQSEACASCPMNKWGSADKGRGKACRNRRRLALIPAGTINKEGEFEAFEEEDMFTKAAVAYLNVAPTSINSFGAYVKQVAGALKRPPFAVFTRVGVVDDDKTQFKLVFESLGPVPNELIPILMERNKAEREVIEFPYAKTEEPAPKPGKRGNKPQPAGRTGRRY